MKWHDSPIFIYIEWFTAAVSVRTGILWGLKKLWKQKVVFVCGKRYQPCCTKKKKKGYIACAVLCNTFTLFIYFLLSAGLDHSEFKLLICLYFAKQNQLHLLKNIVNRIGQICMAVEGNRFLNNIYFDLVAHCNLITKGWGSFMSVQMTESCHHVWVYVSFFLCTYFKAKGNFPEVDNKIVIQSIY